ncbi:5204_t:CDS:1 [Racocetra fulgida]|uniref:5204_t:CDS:1 n=1 Tax=Racocetra fulgida TaxID=60492 RepID=A0A9N9JJW0_9GLOM|nr:5204_t:CDS:1 [Racocetra fulgida]
MQLQVLEVITLCRGDFKHSIVLEVDLVLEVDHCLKLQLQVED